MLRWFLCVAVLAALTGGLLALEHSVEQRGYDRARAEDTAAMEGQKREAAQKLLKLTEKVLESERAAAEAVSRINVKGVENANTILALDSAMRSRIASGLRDPYAKPGCGGGGGSAGGQDPAVAGSYAAEPAEGGGALSEELGQFLREEALSADRVNEGYRACVEYVEAVVGRKLDGFTRE